MFCGQSQKNPVFVILDFYILEVNTSKNIGFASRLIKNKRTNCIESSFYVCIQDYNPNLKMFSSFALMAKITYRRYFFPFGKVSLEAFSSELSTCKVVDKPSRVPTDLHKHHDTLTRRTVIK